PTPIPYTTLFRSRVVHGGIASRVSHFHLLVGQQTARSVDGVHAVGFEQLGDAARQLLNDLVFTGQHGAHVHADFTHLDTVRFEVTLGFIIFVGRLQQGLGGNTAYVQASSTQNLLAGLV